MENFCGFRQQTLEIFGRNAIIVYPKEGTACGRWALKTEYFGAFPDTEIRLLKMGYHIAYIPTISRWYVKEDNVAKKALADYMTNELGLSKKCVIVGMSCGGMQGIYFGADYPECVSCMYLDAPVVNYLSIPFGFGQNKDCPDYPSMLCEFTNAKNITVSEILSYRDMPLDNIPKLIENRIPVILVSGDADTVVCYEENGLLIKEAYDKTDIPFEVYIKKGGDHHPHGLEDNSVIVDFLTKYDK